MTIMTKTKFRAQVSDFLATFEIDAESVLLVIHDREDVQDMTANIIIRRGNDEWSIPIGISGDDDVSIAVHPDTEGYLSLTEGNLYSYLWDKTYEKLVMAKRKVPGKPV